MNGTAAGAARQNQVSILRRILIHLLLCVKSRTCFSFNFLRKHLGMRVGLPILYRPAASWLQNIVLSVVSPWPRVIQSSPSANISLPCRGGFLFVRTSFCAGQPDNPMVGARLLALFHGF